MPLDVRVVDRAGRPIVGLTKDDFTVVDNGAQQDIVHFWEHTLTDGAAQETILRPKPRAEKLAPPSYRVFLIELDRPNAGRIHPPVFGDVRDFLQKRLLHQDYAAIAAFGRVTDFTTDHAALAEVTSRLEALTTKIIGRRDLTRDLWASHPPVGSEADKLLEGVFAPASTGQLALRSRMGFEKLLDAAERSARFVARQTESPDNLQDTVEIKVSGSVGQIIKVIGDIQMLRNLDGEKHLIYAAEANIGADQAAALADIASDARIAVYGIQAHGLKLVGFGFGTDYLMKGMAEITGGKSFPTSWPKEALAMIDAITRTGYLLGYVPTATVDANGKTHNVVVRVKGRPDAQVYARRRYFADVIKADTDMERMLMQQRVMSTAEYPREATDIPIKATALAKDRVIAIEVSIDANQLVLKEDAGRHQGKIEMTAFSTDGRGRLIGEDWRTLTLNLQSDTLAKAHADGLKQNVSLTVTGEPKYVKVVIYDYSTGRAGSAIVKLR